VIEMNGLIFKLILTISSILIFKNIFDFFMIPIRQNKNRKIRTVLSNIDTLLFKTKMALIEERLESTPLLEKRCRRILDFHGSYLNREDKILKLNILEFILYRPNFDKEEIEFTNLQKEVANAEDDELENLYLEHLELMDEIFRISAPKKIDVCIAIAHFKEKYHILKKNNLSQNLRILKKLFGNLDYLKKITSFNSEIANDVYRNFSEITVSYLKTHS